MKKPAIDRNAASVQARWSDPERGRFADLHNLPKPRWRDALKALASPAMRVHRYRNLRSALFYEATCHLDCEDSQ